MLKIAALKVRTRLSQEYRTTRRNRNWRGTSWGMKPGGRIATCSQECIFPLRTRCLASSTWHPVQGRIQ